MISGYTGPIDHLDDAGLLAWLDRWSRAHCGSPVDEQILTPYLQTVIPRSVFVKSCVENATLLDMGAGDGSLSVYKTWPEIQRPDIKLYGTSLAPVERASAYADIRLGNFEAMAHPFEGVRFDAVVAAHFIEHLHDPASFLAWISANTAPGGRLYIEWPHPFSRRMPSYPFFEARSLPSFTTHFMDDVTHVEAWPMEKIVAAAADNGLAVETAGRIVLPHLAAQMRDFARAQAEIVYGTMSIWFAVGWAQYVVLVKPN